MVKNQSDDSMPKFRLLCMEKGPGPAKYLLPGSTGFHRHDPTKHAKPAYSFGVRHKQFSTIAATALSPGPIYYICPEMTRRGKDGTPIYSLTGRPRSINTTCSPAPSEPNVKQTPSSYTKTKPWSNHVASR